MCGRIKFPLALPGPPEAGSAPVYHLCATAEALAFPEIIPLIFDELRTSPIYQTALRYSCRSFIFAAQRVPSLPAVLSFDQPEGSSRLVASMTDMGDAATLLFLFPA